MEFLSMLTRARIRNGTVVATALLAVSQALGAQRPASTRVRDSLVFRLLSPNIDSLHALIQEFDHEQAGTPRWHALKSRIDSLVRLPIRLNATSLVRGVLVGPQTGPQTWSRLGWIGLRTQAPNRQLSVNGELYVTQFAYPLIVAVDPQSPAEKAGIVAGDVLVAYNGADVVNHEFNLTTLLKPDAKLTVTVRRDGDAKDYQLVVARAPQQISDIRTFEALLPAGVVAELPDRPRPGSRMDITLRPEGGLGPAMAPASRLFVITPNGVLGANLSAVSAELGRVLNLRTGVLVNDVPEDSPAFRAGLRTGDVITAVGDQAVISLPDLRRALMTSRERAVPLQVTSRNQKTRTVTISLVPSP